MEKRVTKTKKVEKVSTPEVKATSTKKTAAPKTMAPLGHGVGRRKTAVARVWLRRGNGKVMVNEQDYKTYFDTEVSRLSAYLPFAVYENAATLYNVEANVKGGGDTAQADAVKLGIARALLEVNPEIRSVLKENGLLTVDSRLKERKKYGQRGARRKFQFVKR